MQQNLKEHASVGQYETDHDRLSLESLLCLS